MPRRPRIEQVGQYHVINKGVAQMRIFGYDCVHLTPIHLTPIHPKQSRSFTRRNRECGRGSRGVNQCDEYPYATTLEGGSNWADIWVSTMLVTNEERQGGFVNSFYNGASISIGDEFLVIPQGPTTKYYDKYGIEHSY